MQNYLARRLLYAVPTVLCTIALVFIVMRIMPGDILAAMLGEEGAGFLSEADRQIMMAKLGLDEPIHMQFLTWLWDIVRLDLGESFFKGYSNTDLLVNRAPVTIQIAIMAVIFAWVVGIPVGILAALKQNTPLDYVARFSTILFLATPNFWLASSVVLTYVLVFNWMPPIVVVMPWENPWQNLQQTALPAVVLGSSASATIARMTRSMLLEVVREDYVRTARAKGLRERTVILVHALRNALLPVITLSGLLMGSLMGGSVVVEVAFNVQGLGTTMIDAITERDFLLVQNLVLIYAFVFLFANMAVDVAYAWIDPRIHYE
jgi:peptide/nickel transport system permease protein